MKAILFLLSFSWVLSACAESPKPKYTREECIVRVNIEWGDTTANQKESMIRLITGSIRKAPNMGFNKIPASSAIQGSNREFIYYQHEDDCENRISNMERLLSHIRENARAESLPMMRVDPRRFKPGVETIRVSGPNWVDREKPIGNPVIIDGKKYIEVK